MEHKKSDMNGIIYDEIEEYTINKFIAVGGESIVFKGEKKSVGRTYALKFRDMERWGDFFSYELKTLPPRTVQYEQIGGGDSCDSCSASSGIISNCS